MVFIVSQIFGIYGGALQPLRLITILFLPFLIITFFKNNFIRAYRYEVYYFYFFLLWALISVFFTENIEEAVKAVFYLGINISLFVLIILFAFKSLNPKKSIIYGWIVFFVLSSPMAFMEIFYDYHLPTSVIEKGTLIGGIDELKTYSAVTFGNYNLYNVVLVFTFPFLTVNLFIQKRAFIKFINLLLILFLCYIIITNGSRGGFLCILIGLVYFIFKYFKFGSSSKMNIFIFVCITILLIIKYSNSIFFLLFYRIESAGFKDESRNEIYENGIEMLLDYNLLGVGSGNFQTVMNKNFIIETAAAHNLFLEILVQYGIFIFIGFIILLIRIFNRNKHVDKFSNYIVLLGLYTFPIAVIINSNYLDVVNTWVYLSSLLIIGDKKFLSLKNHFVNE
jgi:teichuronic acid biosynthesis protein TuaE